MRTIGILALQGDFAEHAQRLRDLGCNVVELRSANDIHDLDGLVLPGGESTVQTKLLETTGMREPLKQLIEAGIPTLGTCAGLVLLAQEVEHGNGSREATATAVQPGAFGTLPVRVRRNAYGRQLASFHTEAPLHNPETPDQPQLIPMTFIRAPQITEVAEGVEILAQVEDAIVAVRYQNQLGISFHPELDQDNILYNLFLS